MQMDELVRGINRLAADIGGPVRLMEVCGTHTMAIFRHGLRDLLPESITLISGPGCPVCVTSMGEIDAAVQMAKMPGVTLATFGDMVAVPGSGGSLNDARAAGATGAAGAIGADGAIGAAGAAGADVRVVYSPLDALAIAESESKGKVVFFAAGFETTAPSVAATIYEADRRGVENFYVHSVHKTVPLALRALLDSPEVAIDGFLMPGHVSTIIGVEPYGFIASEYGKPAVIAGFDAPEIMEAILMVLNQIASGKARVEVQYRKVVRDEGNPRAVKIIEEYFEPADSHWRGIGVIPGSGLVLREKYRSRDALSVFGIEVQEKPEPRGCSCGEVLRGIRIPTDCPLFAKSCTPESPVGACMVSFEGSCSVYYRFGGRGGRGGRASGGDG